MRDIMRLVEGETLTFLFHATAASSLPAIRREGLTPNTDRDPTFDGYPVDGRLYVAKTEKGAEFYARTLHNDFDIKPVILRFPAKGIRVEGDEYGNPSDGYTTQAIPPSVIEKQTEAGWAPLDYPD